MRGVEGLAAVVTNHKGVLSWQRDSVRADFGNILCYIVDKWRDRYIDR